MSTNFLHFRFVFRRKKLNAPEISWRQTPFLNFVSASSQLSQCTTFFFSKNVVCLNIKKRSSQVTKQQRTWISKITEQLLSLLTLCDSTSPPTSCSVVSLAKAIKLPIKKSKNKPPKNFGPSGNTIPYKSHINVKNFVPAFVSEIEEFQSGIPKRNVLQKKIIQSWWILIQSRMSVSCQTVHCLNLDI